MLDKISIIEATSSQPVISRRHLNHRNHRSRSPQGHPGYYPNADEVQAATAALILATSRSHLLTRILTERNNRAFQSDLSSVEKPLSLEPQTSSQSAFQSPSLPEVSPVIKDDQETLKAQGTVFENHLKNVAFEFAILVFATNFCPIKIDLSVIFGLQKVTILAIFGLFY